MNKSLEKLINHQYAPLSSLVCIKIQDGRVVNRFSGGYCRLNNFSVNRPDPVSIDTRFRIASISKLVTAVGFLKLVDCGLVNLDSDCGDLLGFELRNPNFGGVVITPRQLLTHTSSIRDGQAYALPLQVPLEACFNPALNSPYYEEGAHWGSHPPGKYFSYTNLNFGILGTVIEKITGQRFDRYMRAEILKPLGIRASFNVLDFGKKEMKKLATLYRGRSNSSGENIFWEEQADDYRGRPVRNLPPPENPDTGWLTEENLNEISLDRYKIGTNGTRFSPQGGLRISAEELVRVANLFFKRGRPLLSRALFDEMISEQWRCDKANGNGDSHRGLMRSWGLGIHRFTHTGTGGFGDKIHPNQRWRPVGHLGEAYGLLSGFLVEPDRGNGLIYIVGGTGVPLEQWPGHTSSFTGWEEALFKAVLAA